MDFSDVLRKRQMVRSYTEEPVSDDALNRILWAVRRAPSAGFSQGHRLVVVTDAKLRRQAADISEGRYLEFGFPPWISTAPVHIYVGIRERSYHERYGQAEEVRPGYTEIPWPVPFWWFDAGAMFMLLQLAAINERLATGYFSSVYTDELDALAQVAGMPDDVALAGVITVGHPDNDFPIPVPDHAVPRRPNDELIEWRR
ncbi:nitroreductase family protein [Streptosporangium carneum]|uniref:Nitroreductase domain-containing protein n=1 Tax=Streptosporangium carneum TaxID=47481 RepID=A0A9W6I3K1_9ACTN|nr:nitroreductase family protein [Streptosporangium carneum]GLK11017.1 hypothetical protein GCM10017600_44230 [Streptosporangium carneum]